MNYKTDLYWLYEASDTTVQCVVWMFIYVLNKESNRRQCSTLHLAARLFWCDSLSVTASMTASISTRTVKHSTITWKFSISIDLHSAIHPIQLCAQPFNESGKNTFTNSYISWIKNMHGVYQHHHCEFYGSSIFCC